MSQLISPAKDARLAKLRQLKLSTCYCSECGATLKYATFAVHPCFREAVARLGRHKARLSVRRLEAPPALDIQMKSGQKRPRSDSDDAKCSEEEEADVTQAIVLSDELVVEELSTFGTFFRVLAKSVPR
jgi:hypothetical protein